ncbi:hypothetical protein SAMN05421690_10213 [Nitrosomonas sp. Nm51]|uniref:hypothetical protein n=1 Tax=Nitrosomonas sp. Nm51 TaxID=133720 RepID=UPI0008AD7D5F|nr:hypothetical protein [Nitrosomonas sp. Nm51]SER35406.1 hypothetical protein SAMN05421690_10213 [Nitrosomonas sp. Nm51]
MARHYSTKSFFRQMPNALLARYFHERNLLLDFDFTIMKEGNPAALFEVWLSLPDGQRNVIDSEFREIYDMSCEKGFTAILHEAEFQFSDKTTLHDFIEKLSALTNHYERAMITFLDHKNCWKVATLFYHADTLTHWRKRKNLPQTGAAIDEASINQLAVFISSYFHHTEGRGKNCVVEPYRRGELDYFFAYPEDYSQHSIEWVDGQFDCRPHNPAFEIIYVYSKKEGSLDLNFRGAYKAIEPLQNMFAQAILKLDNLPPDPKDTRVYDLDPLLQKSFDFTYMPASGIESVIIKKLRLSSRIKKGDRITLEANTEEDPDAVYSLFEQVKTSLPMNMYSVTQVELSASVVIDAEKPARKVTFRITYPNSCTLKYDETDLKLRDMLEVSGIEPKEPESVDA